MTTRSAHATEQSIILERLKSIPKFSRAFQRTYTVLVHTTRHIEYMSGDPFVLSNTFSKSKNHIHN